jgi:Tfp pilus assembly protein PilF
MRQGNQSKQSVCIVIAAVLTVALSTSVPVVAAGDKSLEEQLSFGIQMAKRGLWNEAVFRFSKVLSERPGDVRVLNNMAVAYEAIGEFDLALEHYKKALEGDSSNRDLRRNYAQFVEFYESLKPEENEPDETEPAAGSAGDEVPEAGAESSEEKEDAAAGGVDESGSSSAGSSER